MILVSGAEMRRLDQLTIERYGTAGYTLMTRAGTGAATMLLSLFPHVRSKRVVVLAGKGNNGGDGFIVARLLRRKGVKVEVILLGKRSDLKGDALKAMRAYLRGGGQHREASPPRAVATVAARIDGAALIVDALFGTGLNAPLAGAAHELVELVNSSGTPVFAIDMPSGLDADRGVPLGTCIQAEATATFGFAKLGQVLYPGAGRVGILGVVDIGIAPEALAEVNPRARLIDQDVAAALVPRRAPEAHKGTTGHVLIVAGSRGHSGAALLSAHAACRMGAGLTTLAGPASLNQVFSTGKPEVMTAELPDRDGKVDFDSAAASRLLAQKDALVVGPGLGIHPEAVRLVAHLIENSTAPVVLDADALTVVARDLKVLGRAHAPIVLTPHPGEMARLVGGDTAAVQSDRVDCAREFARRQRCIVVLKGARTVIAAANGDLWINPTGNPAMASGGMGDALSGMIGGLAAQGLSVADAACLAVYLHGEIGDHLAANRGPIGILASDIIDGIPAGVARLLGVATTPSLPHDGGRG